jgi:hypothetical protein
MQLEVRTNINAISALSHSLNHSKRYPKNKVGKFDVLIDI